MRALHIMKLTLFTTVALLSMIILGALFYAVSGPVHVSWGPTQEPTVEPILPFNGGEKTQEVIDTKLGISNLHPTHMPRPTVPVVATPTTSIEGCGLLVTAMLTDSADPSHVQTSISITNRGSESCRNVSISAYYPDGEVFVSASPAPTASNYYWALGDITSGSARTITLITQREEQSDPLELCATSDNGGDVCAMRGHSTGGVAVPIPNTSQPKPVATLPSVTTPGAVSVAPAGRENGIWVWEKVTDMTAVEQAQVLSAISTQKFTSVYVTIDNYLEIAALPAGESREASLKAYAKDLSNFIVLAHGRGIAVDVEGGWKDWAKKESRWKGYALIDFVTYYNTAYPSAKVRALQYDVEPYLLDEYEDNKAEVLTDFVEFIAESTTRMQNNDAALSVVIPHFYDSAQRWTPQVVYNGQSAHTVTHLLTILEKKKGSTIVIMSYRNFFDGSDGVEGISNAELREASTQFSTKVVIAQETGNVSPEYVTFFGKSRQDMMSTIYSQFSSYKNFGGIATHYYDSYFDLR